LNNSQSNHTDNTPNDAAGAGEDHSDIEDKQQVHKEKDLSQCPEDRADPPEDSQSVNPWELLQLQLQLKGECNIPCLAVG